MFPAERMEDDDLIDAVEEFGAKMGLQDRVDLITGHTMPTFPQLVAQVAGHDDHCIAEIDGPPMPVCKATFIQQLQQHVEYLAVGFLNLVKQNHTVGPAADRLGQLSTFFIANISRRCANQARNGVFLLVFTHVDAHHCALVIEEKLGQSAGQLGLADSRRSKEYEGTDRSVGVLQTSPRTADGIGDHSHSITLADYSLMQPRLHVDQFFCLTFQQTRHRYPRPTRNDLGYLLRIDLLL